MADPFPWAAAMRFGLGVLRLAPRDFWSMTPRELAAAMGRAGDPAGRPTRAWLERQIALRPDRNTKPETAHDGDR